VSQKEKYTEMAITVEALKDLATNALQAKFGPNVGKAHALLFFGGPKVSGLVDGPKLGAVADSQPGNDIPADRALSLVLDAAKASFAENLQSKASAAIAAGQLTADGVAQAVEFIVGGRPPLHRRS
jgi:hypothetical protein